MKKTHIEDKPIPQSCPNTFTISSDHCDVSFKDGKNLYQNTDGTLYCMNCGIVIGVYRSGKLPVVRRDDNVLPQ